jgi:zinc protease
VANRIFGGFFSSRLNLNLREDKGYTYGVRSTLSERAGRGALSAGGRVQAEVTAPALVEFLKEIEGASGKRPFTQPELDFAKNSIVLGYAQQFETVGQLAVALQGQTVFGLPDDSFARFPERVSSVDLAAANAAGAALYHPDDLAVVVVGDLTKIEKPVRDLKLGPVVYLDREGRRIEQTAMSAK